MDLNIYEFLGFEDTNVDDNSVIQKLQKQRYRWNNETKQLERKEEKLEQIRELQAEYNDNPNMLKEHREKFVDLQKEKKKDQYDKLKEDKVIYCINDEIEKDKLEKLQRACPLLTREEILEALGGVRVTESKRHKPTPEEKGKLIDRIIYNDILKALKALNKKSLYDFLGLTYSASVDAIKAKNDEIYRGLIGKDIHREGYNDTKKLTGMVSEWLYSEEKRIDYDKTLRNEAFLSVQQLIEKMVQYNGAKIIHPIQYEKLVEVCSQMGMELTRAESLIDEDTKNKGIILIEKNLSSKTIVCRFCGSINDKESKNCKNKDCGMPLLIVCPKCKTKSVSTDEIKCAKCGFGFRDMPRALEKLREAENRLSLNNIDGAMQSYLDAERFWPSFEKLPEIKSKILSVTPPPPKSLNATVSGNTVNLRWTCDKTEYIVYKYLVVRKADGVPNSPKDGEQVSITTDNQVSEVIHDAGISYYYAVYALNGNSVSAQSAKNHDPIMIVADLKASDIILDIKETKISFNFKKTNAKSIDIYRDERRIASITGNTFIDSDLKTGQSYNYRFVATYVDNKGILHQSNGTTLTISPVKPPMPVEIKLIDGEKVAKLSWDNPSEGTLVLFQSDKPFTFLPGNSISLDSLRCEKVETNGTSVSIAKNWSGVRYYLPVTVNRHIGVAGKAISVLSIDTVSGIDVSLEDRGVVVKWMWKNCSSVRISYTIDGKIKKDKDVKKEGSHSHEFVFKAPEGCKSVSVSVMAIVETPERTLLSAPITRILSLKPAKVQFVSVKNKKSFFMPSNKYEITYDVDSSLPCDLHLLVSESVPPMDLVNYTPIVEIKAADMVVGTSNSVIIEYIRKNKKTPLFFRLIVADRKLSKNVIVKSEIMQLK